MKSCFIFAFLLIFLLLSEAMAEIYTSPDGHNFAVNLQFPKTTIMLGEPIYFDFEIENLSDVALGAVFGGDYRNEFGRPDSFDVKIIDEEGGILIKPKTWTFGGIINVRKIEVNQKFDFRLYLPHWATIEKVGSYKVQVEKDLIVRKYDEKNHSQMYSQKVSPIKLNATINFVSSDYQKMGVIIDEIGKQLVTRDETAQKLAPFINGTRIIKYLIEAVEKDHWLMSHLSKFNDDWAFNAIVSKIKDERDEVRRNVSISLSLSVHPQAFTYLLKMRNDIFAPIRLDVVHYLGKTKTKESTKLLKEMVNDEDKWVRDEARRYLTERGEKLN